MRLLIGLLLASLIPFSIRAQSVNPNTNIELPQEQPVGSFEAVALFYDSMPTGVTVSQNGRIFVNFPRWDDPVEFTVAEVRNAQTIPYPSTEINRPDPNNASGSLLSVQSVVVDPLNRLWLLDTGRIEFQDPPLDGPKLVGVDLQTNRIFKTIVFPPDVALPTTYLNDIRFDLRRGEAGMAFITDSSSAGPNAIIVVDLASGRSWRQLNNHPSTQAVENFLPSVEGQPLKNRPPNQPPSPIQVGADGIAMGPEGQRLYYCPLASRHLYSVSIDALVDEQLSEAQVAATVIDYGDKGGAADGLESDARGRVYVTNFEHNAIFRRLSDGEYETVVHDPRILWPDTLALAEDGYLYFTANQLHRRPVFHNGQDLREKPYSLFRTRVDAPPVRLR